VKLARDTWLTLQYEGRLLLTGPIAILTMMFQPVAFLLFFTPFLKSVLHVSSYQAAFQIYVPSLLCITGLFAGLFAGFSLLAAMRQGVIGRFQVTPVSRTGLLLGRELTLVFRVLIQSILITVLALIFGLRVRPANFVLALLVLAMTVILGVSIAYALALAVPNESVLPTLMNGLAQPLSLLAGLLIPLTVAPLWLRDVALWNPWAWTRRSSGRRPRSSSVSAWSPWCCRPSFSTASSHDRSRRDSGVDTAHHGHCRGKTVVLRSFRIRVSGYGRHQQEADK
jgi:ABC-2 type transport system permease protein